MYLNPEHFVCVKSGIGKVRHFSLRKDLQLRRGAGERRPQPNMPWLAFGKAHGNSGAPWASPHWGCRVGQERASGRLRRRPRS